ncbi:MAG: RNA polymerase sigma factor, partial [Bacteroidales bacterium]
FEGYDHEEISEILEINNATSRTILTRAKMNLRKFLSKDELIISD